MPINAPAPTCPCGQCDGTGLSWDDTWNEWHCAVSGAEYAAEEVEPQVGRDFLDDVAATAMGCADHLLAYRVPHGAAVVGQLRDLANRARAFTPRPKSGGVGAPVASQDRGGRDGRPVPPCCYCGEPGGDCGYVCC